MSWQDYIDTNLIGTGKISQAAILSKDGNSIWAHSKGFEPSANERKALADIYNNPQKAYEDGITLDGKKYMLLNIEENLILAKLGANGAITAQTKQTILITIILAPIQMAEAFPVVANIADYLISYGY
ncbi:profilin [Coleofasciculus sp. FACHB-64]|uniref:profilin n=1 Tax=Cyanophyceae TaxID=3028117 RepID=UPI0016858D02|nr:MULTISPECIES: profilin [unclassified Coleofasciculus]MBD1893860.1 profilin [Coleofasciculus sp. FACHB-129]MBD2044955.1 profilin [Coleofasciculus sp. FACHB-64]MBD2540835.1 profilin [Coleofasciculus sp. FACHB-SPT36]